MGGISNFQIKEAIKKIGDEAMKTFVENFLRVFPLNYMNKFIDHASISDKGKYHFIIANADSSNKPGVHWRSILDIETKTDIFSLILLDWMD